MAATRQAARRSTRKNAAPREATPRETTPRETSTSLRPWLIALPLTALAAAGLTVLVLRGLGDPVPAAPPQALLNPPPPITGPPEATAAEPAGLKPALKTVPETAPKPTPQAASAKDPAAPVPDDPDTVRSGSDLDQRLAALAVQIAELGRAGDQSAQNQSNRDQISQAADLAQEALLAARSLKTESAALAERLQNVEAALEQLKISQATPKDWSLVIALGHLRQSVQAGRPYADDLAAVARIAAAIPSAAGPLDVLRPHAAQGLPAGADLSRQLTAQAARWAEGEDAAAGPQADADLWERAAHRLRGLVRVRQTSERTGGGSEARIARAERRLAEDDLAAAAAEVAPLPIPAARRWARQAADRAGAERALRDLAALATASEQAVSPP